MKVIWKRLNAQNAGVPARAPLAGRWAVAMEQQGFDIAYSRGRFNLAIDGELHYRWSLDGYLIEFYFELPLVLPIRGGGAL